MFPCHLTFSNPSSTKPPQSLLFPNTENLLALVNTPTNGTSPSRLLKDKFIYCNEKCTKNRGTGPDKLLFERSGYTNPLKELSDRGIMP